VSSLALKEWAVVVRALLAGEQILDLRKGGIREDERRFDVRSRRFWLYPTTEHQRPELVKPAYRRWVTSGGDEPTEHLRIDGWADVVGVATITDAAVLESLESKFVWTRAYAEGRLQWKQRQPLWVLALRAFLLAEPVDVTMRAEYVGCASWVELDGLPDDPASLPSEPALSDESFAARLELCSGAIPGGLAAPEGD
jgi:hypothetical protein